MGTGGEAALAVEASIAWHDAWMGAFGLRTEADGDAWRLLDPAPQPWYFTAITRRPGAPPEAVANGEGMVCDAWSSLDLAPLGFEPREEEPWFHRPAGPLERARAPSDLDIVRATTPAEIEEFEAVSVGGFEAEDSAVGVGSVHPATILGHPRMTCWIGRVAGRAVAAAMSYRTEGAVGVFGVATVPSARRRGYGTDMTRSAILADSGLPAVLSPTPEGEDLYRRLGFTPVGRLRMWWRGTPSRHVRE